MIKKKGFFTVVLQGLIAFTSGLHFIFLSKYLGPVDYGIFVFITSIGRMASPLSLFGRNTLLLSDSKVSDQKSKFIAQEFIGATFITSLILCVLVLPIAVFATNNVLSLVYIALIVFSEVFVRNIFEIWSCRLLFIGRYIYSQVVTLLFNVLRTLSLIIAIGFFSFDLENITVIKCILMLILFLFMLYDLGPWVFDSTKTLLGWIKSQFSWRGFQFGIVDSSDYLSRSGILVVSGFILSSLDYGFFSTGMQLVLFMTFITKSLVEIKRREFFETGINGSKAVFITHFSYHFKYFLFSVFLGVFLLLFAKLVPFLIGKKYIEAIELYQLAALTTVLLSIETLFKKILVFGGKNMTCVAISFLNVIIFSISIFILSARLNVTGFTILVCFSLTTFLTLWIQLFYIFKRN